jgi:hypothetical protein
MTLEMPAIDFKGQSAPIGVSLTSLQLKGLFIGQCCIMHAHASKTRYFEKFETNISARRIQTKLSTQKRLNTRSILPVLPMTSSEKFRRYSTFSLYEIQKYNILLFRFV